MSEEKLLTIGLLNRLEGEDYFEYFKQIASNIRFSKWS